jgi:hypothetical protein
VTDRELLRTCGLIGGAWSEATDGATYQVGGWRLAHRNLHRRGHHSLQLLLQLRCCMLPSSLPPPVEHTRGCTCTLHTVCLR